MPALSPISQAKLAKLPPIVQALIDRLIPPDTIPIVPPGPASVVYRAPGDIDKVLGRFISRVPAKPAAQDQVGKALEDFLQKSTKITQQMDALKK